MLKQKQRFRCLAIVWMLNCDLSTPFVHVTTLTSTLKRTVNHHKRPNERKRKISSRSDITDSSSHKDNNLILFAVKLDAPTTKNQTENDIYFAQRVHTSYSSGDSLEFRTSKPTSKTNGIPRYSFKDIGEPMKMYIDAELNADKEIKNTKGTSEKSRRNVEVYRGSIEDVYEEKTWTDNAESLRDSQTGSENDNSQSLNDSGDDAKRENKEPLEMIDESLPMRLLWRKRNARTLEEGIRRERATKLSSLLNRAQMDNTKINNKRYVERILMGLINAVAEEIEDLDVEITSNPRTPLWRKELKEVRINFSRLGFKPLRMGGSKMPDEQYPLGESQTNLSLVESADEAFNRIDKDDSGTLDRDEIAEALAAISADIGAKESLSELASELVDLYDANSDGVVDREEYQLMIEDMASLRPKEPRKDNPLDSPLKTVKRSVESFSKGISEKAAEVASAATRSSLVVDAKDFPDEKELGSIVLSDLNLDLRRLVFGGIPVVKKVTPGGPLILEPFTATLTGSFSREDVMGSFLLDSGLRLLVARVLRVRIRSYRDIVDGALFFGRRWKMTSKSAPVVEVLGLSNVEFDAQDKMILTGRARIRTGPDAPVVTNTFKVRTKIGTGKRGQTIRLVEPELAFVFECPRAWENGLQVVCEKLGMPPPKRPEPFYSFFPIYSPLKVTDENAGFDMGDDNKLKQIFIKNGKLRFQMSCVLRPGRFLGSHYIAFTLPMRTFIITMDRVREGARTARKNKKIAAREKELKRKAQQDTDFSVELAADSVKKSNRLKQMLLRVRQKKTQKKPTKSFFSRFVEGYTLVEREGDTKNERFADEISDWFGRQGSPNSTSLGEDVANAVVDIATTMDSK